MPPGGIPPCHPVASPHATEWHPHYAAPKSTLNACGILAGRSVSLATYTHVVLQRQMHSPVGSRISHTRCAVILV